MHRLFTLWLFFSLFYAAPQAQIIRHTPESSHTLSTDTALANRLIRTTLPLAFNPSTQDSAIKNLDRILRLSTDRNYQQGIAEFYRLWAVIYYTRHAKDSTIRAMEREFDYAARSQDPLEMAKALDLKAWLFQTTNEPDSATHYYIQTLAITDSLGELKFSGEIYNNISVLFLQIGDTAKSGDYALRGYEIGKRLNDTLLIANCLFNLANAKTNLHQLDTAYRLLEQIREMVHDPNQYNCVLTRAIANEGGILNDQGRFQEALAKYDQLLAIKETIRPDLLSFIYSERAFTLYSEGKYQQANTNMDSALASLQAHPGENVRIAYRDSYRIMSGIQEALKRYGSALYYKKKEDSVTNLIAGEQTRKNMHLLETKYELARKDKMIAEQNLALSRTQAAVQKRNILVAFITGSLLALVIILVLSIRSYRHKRELDHQSMLTLQKQHEVNTLKARMEAREEERNRIGQEMHDDIGSALTTILYLTEDVKSPSTEKSFRAADRISRTASTVVDKMNEIIWSMNGAYDTVDDLIAYSRQHAVELMEDHGLEYDFEAPEDLPDIRLSGEQRRNLYLTMKEALHNTIKHAEASRVAIEFRVEDTIKVVIRDNGMGIRADELRRFGNGLRNMRQRMEAIGGSFTISGTDGTTVELCCPLLHLPVDKAPPAAAVQTATTVSVKVA